MSEVVSDPKDDARKIKTAIVGFVAVILPVAGCGGQERPDAVQSLPLCAAAGDREKFDPPKPGKLVFNADTGRLEGQPEPDPNIVSMAELALAQVYNFANPNGGAGTGVIVEVTDSQKAVLTAGHVTLVAADKLAEMSEVEAVTGNSVRLAGRAAVYSAWGCSPYENEGSRGKKPDVSVLFPYIGLASEASFEFRDAGCPDGAHVTIATLQNGRQPGDPAVYPGYMTRLKDGSGSCVVVNGFDGTFVEPGASGGAVLLDGKLIALIGGSVNPTAGTSGVEVWNEDLLAQHTGLTVVGSGSKNYAVAWVVTGADIKPTLDEAVQAMPDDMRGK